MAVPIFSGDLGPCSVEWNGAIVGPTQGGVKFKIEAKIAEIKEDGYGVAAVDGVFTGIEVGDVEVPLTRFTLAQLDILTKDGDLAGSVLTVPNPVGMNMYDEAKALVLKPLVNNVASAVTTEWVTFFKAYPYAKWEVGYDNSNQRIYKVAFKIFVCQDSPNVNDILKLGA
jgi:hypothetical protein